MVAIQRVLGQLAKKRILVAGDLMLDTYTKGRAGRISPEAPVAVVHVVEDQTAPGGAGNVVLNLKALGAEVVLLSRIGLDDAGKVLVSCFRKEGGVGEALFVDPDFTTPVKNRVVAQGQQILRIDREDNRSLSPWLEEAILNQLDDLFENIDLVALSDYGKGFLTDTLLKALIQKANERAIPIIADPKGLDFAKYQNVTLLKPNRQEAYNASGFPSDTDLRQVAKGLFKMSKATHLLITLSEEGMALFENQGDLHMLPVKAHEVKDVTGAGDTTLAVLSFALANQIPLKTACELANLAAGIAIERFGCARVSLGDLAHRLLSHEPENKFFEKDALFPLECLIENKPFSLLKLEAGALPSLELFRDIRNRAKKDHLLILQLEDAYPDSELVDFLTSLSEVNAVVAGNALAAVIETAN